MGALDAVPPESVRSAVFGFAPGVALLMDSTPVSTSVLHVAFADAGSGPSPTVCQIPPLNPLVEASLSQAEAPASQACLVAPEPTVVGSSAQVHKIGIVVDGSSMGAVSLSNSKLASNPAIQEAFSLPWEEDFPTSSWGEVSGSEVADSIEAPVLEVSLANTVRSPPQAPSLIRWGFFSPRSVSPSPSGVKEASLSSKRKDPPPKNSLIRRGEFWFFLFAGEVV